MIYDHNTSNLSFLKMSKKLKDLGIKNNKFFLRLEDETLSGVDPYSPNLTNDQKIRIQVEVMRNFWYYLREVVRIPETGGSIPFQLHRGNLSQMFLMELNVNIFEVLPRQNGKTIGAVCRYVWVVNFGTTNTKMVFSNKQLGDSKLNLKRFNDITDLLPSYLKGHFNPKKDTNNVTSFFCDKNKNSIDVIPSPISEEQADKLGRGLTIPIIWYDELAFLKYNDTVTASAGPALGKAAESARRNGTPYGQLITTTPNDLDSASGSFAYSIMKDAVPFDEAWYDWDTDSLKEFIEENSRNDFVHIEFNYEELGHDEKWFKKQCKLVNNDLLKIKREILLEWTLANDTSPFSEEQLSTIETFSKNPIGKFYIREKYKFDVYEHMPNILNKSWIVAIDLGGGLSRDFSSIVIIDPKDRKPKAIFKSNNISVPDMQDLVIELTTVFLPNSVIIPERNSIGVPFIQSLLRTEVANKIYYETKDRKGEKTVVDPKLKSLRKGSSEKRIYGIYTDKTTRKIMFDEILFGSINEDPEIFIAKPLFDEIRTLERKKTGKIEHRDGCNDDILMAWLIGSYALLYGGNISKFVKVISDGIEANNISNDTPYKNNKTRNVINNLNIINNKNNSSFYNSFIDKNKENYYQSEESDPRKIKRARISSWVSSLNK
ncbi:terminase large subunit [Bacillus phage vB_BpuM-BpSp]|nr:terminase large subunit [Bacillus phage vB_BpuM-BpSp]